MKKVLENVSYSPAESRASMDSTQLNSANVYIDMLCDRFKNRGVSQHIKEDVDRQNKKEEQLQKRMSKLKGKKDVRPTDTRFRTEEYNGQRYMSSEDFASYYIELRDYKMPHFYSRPESEYAKNAEDESGESRGTPPKKARGLAVIKELPKLAKKLLSKVNAENFSKFVNAHFPEDSKENRIEEKGRRVPVKILAGIFAIAISLLMVISSSVMVSRAEREVSNLKDELDASRETRDKLEAQLEVKNDMLKIRDIAVNEYGMVSGSFVNSEYVSSEKQETNEKVKKPEGQFFIDVLLSALGIK